MLLFHPLMIHKNMQQTSQLENKSFGGIWLGKAIRIWQRLKSIMRSSSKLALHLRADFIYILFP